MSVVDLIRVPEVRELLDPIVNAIPYRRSPSGLMIVPWTRAANAGVMGTAFDYAVRLELQRRVPGAVAERWIAKRSAEMLREAVDSWHGRGHRSGFVACLERLANEAERRVRNARIFQRKHLLRRNVDEPWLRRLCAYALKLARLDPCFRAVYIDEPLVHTDDAQTVDELRDLFRAVPFDLLMGRRVFLNPSFGRGSASVGGADADIITDTRLIELKTRGKCHVTREDVRQLVVYAMLVDVAREDGAKYAEIDTLQVYFARHGRLVTLPFDAARRHPAYASARAALLRLASLRYRNPREDRTRV